MPPCPWSCTVTLDTLKSSLAALTICFHVAEQQGLIIEAQDKPCQSVCNFLTSSKPPQVASETGRWGRALSPVGGSFLLLWLLPLGVDMLFRLLWCFLRNSSPLSATEALAADGEGACLLLPEVTRLWSSPSCESPFTTPITADPLSVQLRVQAFISARSLWRCHQSLFIFPDAVQPTDLLCRSSSLTWWHSSSTNTHLL